MKIRTLYRRDVLTAEPLEDLAQAAGRMDFHQIGALPVMEHGAMVGIITERDLVRAVAEGVDLEVAAVGDYMTRGVVSVSPRAELAEAVDLMQRVGARHLPVLEMGEVVGMLSARDLLDEELWRREVNGR